MNKSEAAAHLNVSTRAVERYTAAGRLTPTYEKGRTGPAPVYDRAQLDALKREMSDGATEPRRPVKHDKPAKHDSKPTALAIPQRKLPELAQFFAAVEAARTAQPSIADLAAKPILTRAEAQKLTGLSRGVLKAAVQAGKLKETLIGRAYRIKRDDLDKFIKGL